MAITNCFHAHEYNTGAGRVSSYLTLSRQVCSIIFDKRETQMDTDRKPPLAAFGPARPTASRFTPFSAGIGRSAGSRAANRDRHFHKLRRLIAHFFSPLYRDRCAVIENDERLMRWRQIRPHFLGPVYIGKRPGFYPSALGSVGKARKHSATGALYR